MARIRTIKPEYFRHELLQDLEILNPGLHPMLVFAGLWGQCDKNGVFEYKPRQLKLDILPFLEYDMGASLTLLREAKLIALMLHGEKVYGFVPSFKDHQRINGKEAQDNSKFPQPSEMIEYNQEGSTGEALGKHEGRQEGKGREEEGKGVGDIPAKPSRPAPKAKLTDDEWMQEIKNNVAYTGIDVEKLKGKLDAWCLTKGLKPTRARLLNWLNREEKPLTQTAEVSSYEKPEFMRGVR